MLNRHLRSRDNIRNRHLLGRRKSRRRDRDDHIKNEYEEENEKDGG